MEAIDFVITWVDGDDPQWKSERKEYEQVFLPKSIFSDGEVFSDDANENCRYRDFGLLRYWFRSVESFAPWVNKIYFITCGQRPDWLNIHHPKIVCLNHSDYIPKQYLPTFNSNTIELNLHRIDSLSERFVLFNDDVFLLQPIAPDYFFHGENPVLISSLRYPVFSGINTWGHFAFNNYCLVNMCHDIGKSIWRNRKKWFSFNELGFHLAARNFLCYLANKTLPVGNYGHIAQPNLKSTIVDIWDKCYDELNLSSLCKFRSDQQVNQWMFCAWNQALGRFYPSLLKNRGARIHISPSNIDWIVDVITEQLFPQVCLNDTILNTEVDNCSRKIVSAFDTIFPGKSSYELF